MTTKDTAGSIAAVYATAALGTLASRGVGSRWYLALRKPAIQPPGPVFGVVWSVLYTDIAVTSAVVLDRLGYADRTAATGYRRALAMNLALNASWSWVFFKGHRLLPATVVAGVLAASSIDLARRAAAARPAAAVALTRTPPGAALRRCSARRSGNGTAEVGARGIIAQVSSMSEVR